MDATAASGATATVGTSTTGASASGNTVTLAPAGETTVIDVEVSGAGLTSQTYTINVDRAAVPTPAGLVIKDGDGNVIDATIELTEGNEVTYTVELATMPEEDVTVTITGTAPDGSTALDATALTAANDAGGTTYITLSTVTRSFTSRNWDIPQDVTIEADEDNAEYSDHDGIVLTHTAASDDDEYDGKDAELEVDIADDDVEHAAVVITDAETGGSVTTTLAIVEANATGGSYWVALAAEPMSDVTISIEMGENDDNVEVSPLSLTFTDDNGATPWDEPQKVTVTAPDDNVDEANKTATLTHKAAGGGYDDATLSANVVTVTVSDDAADVAAVLVSGLGGPRGSRRRIFPLPGRVGHTADGRSERLGECGQRAQRDVHVQLQQLEPGAVADDHGASGYVHWRQQCVGRRDGGRVQCRRRQRRDTGCSDVHHQGHGKRRSHRQRDGIAYRSR